MQFYSQYSQDQWLYENLFPQKVNGTFVEIGADDGVDKSNTKFFEDLGWRGVCIEPSPKRYQLLKNNRASICENVAVSDVSGEAEFMDIAGWGKGLSGIVDKYDERHKIRIERELQHPDNRGRELVKVKTETLSALLRRHGIDKVDLCSIDTEGGEFEIINSINFSECQFGVFLIENNYEDRRVKDFLVSQGYKLVKRLTIDDVYVKTPQE
jgi:FkbM family methyltransferase